ncbi:MAG: N-formylglutamate amidohydrolase [Magnetococcales bacterium]|nr:N-formylglutamate amidohydrolase [Magnetococcales bacterium]
MALLPQWVIFHVPHDSTVVPEEVRNQFALSESELADELIKMTDHHTLDLFTHGIPQSRIVCAPVSRLVVDVERFAEDEREPMARKGMGVVYLKTANGTVLRHPISTEMRRAWLNTWYHPHHERLAVATQRALDQFGQALLIDAHSFPSAPLPYEEDQRGDRPEICIGTDAFHTPKALELSLLRAFNDSGLTTRLNSPFAGAMVPMPHFRKDVRVSTVMVEVRRDLYICEASGVPSPNFLPVAQQIRKCIGETLKTVYHNGIPG